ncbi:MAG: CpsB/CapC family capsule biosynthesis tyrosine phosphatase [Deltaproteobacteria bacterium]|nr:CpsB/CapC family capsule biosynthesis tyrosine phosphatase [Deltaproteobacteria bacterium]
MIDIHCHILPGMDDGPASLGEALAMCHAAAADGVTTIVAAPHFKPGTYEFTGPEILATVDILDAEAKKEGLDIRILPGAEVTVSPEMPAYLQTGKYLTINNNGRYFLAEFSPLSVPADWDAFLLGFLRSGMIPIIAHPERNAWFMRHPDALSSAVQRGLMVQITAASVTGCYGDEARDFSVYLLKQNLVHAIGSDGHSANLRLPLLAEAVSLAADVVGKERAEALVTSIPQAIIEGRDIPVLGPIEYSLSGTDLKSVPRSWKSRKWLR